MTDPRAATAAATSTRIRDRRFVRGGPVGALIALGVALAACRTPTPGGPAGEPKGGDDGLRVIVISIDGMMAEAYNDPDRHGLKLPTLRRMVAEGVSASGVESIFPSVTYPAHTTLVTGAPPGVHGIGSNREPDPLDRNDGGWRWYAEDIAVPTLWQEVERAGKHAAIVQWPVTVGGAATFTVPEYWRAGTPDDQKLQRALATPGLLEAIEREHPTLWQELTPPNVHDEAQFAIASYLATHEDPALTLVHVWQTDDAQHDHGPWSPEAIAALEHTDGLLGGLLATLEASPDWPRTVLVVVSDHGFAPITQEIRLNALFAKAGLVTLDDAGKPQRARVTSTPNGGVAMIYVDGDADRPTVAALVAAQPGVARVLDAAQIAALGGDRRAAFAAVAEPGYGFGDTRSGEVVVPAKSRGTHGWPPQEPAMAASFLAIGPRVAPRKLGAIRMIDIAPTLAAWLGVPLSGATGAPIEGLLR